MPRMAAAAVGSSAESGYTALQFFTGSPPMRLGMGELVIILAIFVLLFGARRLPELADGMGV